MGKYRFNQLMIMRNFLMMSLSLFLLVVVVLVEGSKGQMVPAVYVFGDSLADVGNNDCLPVSLAKANFPHNGVDYPTKKSTGRFSNGKNVADLLCEKVGLASPPPYLSLKKSIHNIPPNNNASILAGVSFASGGAGIFNGSDQKLGQSIPLTQQIEYYTLVNKDILKQLGSSSRAAEHLSKSLFFIVIGNNDLFDYFGSDDLQKKYTPQQYVNSMADSLKAHLKYLYNSGARKFAMAGISPIGCIPSERAKNETEGCNEASNQASVKYNGVLKSMLEQLKSELNGMFYSYFDAYDITQNMVQHPASYGFKEVKAACCGLGKLNANIPCIPISKYCSNRSDHLFWDLYHPTQATAQFLIDAYFEGSLQYTYPINVKQLVAL
ncbi:hypothetical protein ACFE04_022907 [Oxalis oulophora]